MHGCYIKALADEQTKSQVKKKKNKPCTNLAMRFSESIN